MTRNIVVGTAGHIDHGKSALVHALTGSDPDRLKEEKARGITIDLGFAHLRQGETQLAFVDVPGHERFIKNMLAGVSGIDGVLLVGAADESVMPQTREHFDICRLLHITSGVVALTKIDLVDRETVELVRLETADLLAGSFLGTFLSVIFWLAGYKYTLAGRAAIYIQLSTIFIIILASIFLKEIMTKKKWAAVTLALLGAFIVSVY